MSGYLIMIDEGNVVIEAKDKAELLARVFVKVLSTENLSDNGE